MEQIVVTFDGQGLTDLYMPVSMRYKDHIFIHQSQRERFSQKFDKEKLIVLTDDDYNKMLAGEGILKKHFICCYESDDARRGE